jgi:hypothetical protein
MDSTQILTGFDGDAIEALAKQKRVKLSPEEQYQHNLFTQRRYYDKHRDKIIADKKARRVPSERPIGRPKKSRELIKINN